MYRSKKCRNKNNYSTKRKRKEAMIIKGLKIIPVATLKEVIEYINRE